MKRTSLFVALLALVLAAGAAVAQQDMGNQSGGTFATGVVESFGSDSLTIKKDSGEATTFLIDAQTVGAQKLANGARVRVDYITNEQNQGIAKVIELNSSSAVAAAPAVEVESQVAVETPAPAAPVDTYRAPAAEPAAPVASEPAPMQTAEAAPAPEALPATASRLPLFALLGVLALAGGVAVRAVR